ncbi:hypothetical protein CCP3SC1AL1_3010007 [Gammaproteobacteria bacterium]
MTEEETVLVCRFCGTEMQEGRHSACEHSNSAYIEKDKLPIKEEFKLEGSELEKSLMKHGDCFCGRKGLLHRGKCYFCFLEEVRDITQQLEKEISEGGRNSLIDTEKMRAIRDKLLELI